MLYISDIYDVFTQEHFLSLRGHIPQQDMYCVELRDFITGKQAVLCRPKGALSKKYKSPFGVANDGNLFVVDSQFRDLLSYIDVEEDFEHTSFELSVKYHRQVYPLDFIMGVDSLGLCLYEASLHPSRVSGNSVNIVDVIVQYNQRHPEYDLLHSRDFYFSYENTQVLGKKIYHITFDKDLSLELTKYAIKWRLV